MSGADSGLAIPPVPTLPLTPVALEGRSWRAVYTPSRYRLIDDGSGEWSIVPHPDDNPFDARAAVVVSHGAPDDRRRADALLIAAAPDLLAALSGLLECTVAATVGEDLATLVVPVDRFRALVTAATSAVTKALDGPVVVSEVGGRPDLGSPLLAGTSSQSHDRDVSIT